MHNALENGNPKFRARKRVTETRKKQIDRIMKIDITFEFGEIEGLFCYCNARQSTNIPLVCLTIPDSNKKNQ